MPRGPHSPTNDWPLALCLVLVLLVVLLGCPIRMILRGIPGTRPLYRTRIIRLRKRIRSTRPTSFWGKSVADLQDEEGEEDEDWNVYDDFNNVRPLAHGPIAAGLTDPVFQTKGGYEDSDDEEDELVPIAAGTRAGPALLANAFGFDVQNSDPRTWDEQQRAAISLAKERNAIAQPNPEHQLELADHGIEMITVPALGSEWTDEERKRMARPYKRKQRRKKQKRTLLSWGRRYQVLGIGL